MKIIEGYRPYNNLAILLRTAPALIKKNSLMVRVVAWILEVLEK